MADTYVPMISSGVAGPLGILHLPRLWLKVSLESQGKLASGYPGIGRGFDAMTCAALGLEEQAVRDYIHDDETRKGVLGACAISDDASAPKDAVNLNNLDDWYEFHRAVLA